MAPVDFKNLKRMDRPNQYLVCPKDYCNIKPNLVSEVYSHSLCDVQAAWQKMIEQQSRVIMLNADENNQTYVFVQRSKWLHFPDFIHVHFIPIDDDHSTIAIYSTSKYGYYDFGVNQHRVRTWLALLKAELDSKA